MEDGQAQSALRVEIRLPRSQLRSLWVLTVIMVGFFTLLVVASIDDDGPAAALLSSPILLFVLCLLGWTVRNAHRLRLIADASGLVVINHRGVVRWFEWSEIDDFRVGELAGKSPRAAVFVLPHKGPMLALDVTRRGALSEKEQDELGSYVRDLRAAARAWTPRPVVDAPD